MQGILGIRDGVLKNSGKSNPSARDFVTFSGRGQVQDAMVGGPKEIADKLEEMFVERGCDGFVIAATYVPGLGKIPVLGRLFKTTKATDNKTDLMFFVTPKVLPG